MQAVPELKTTPNPWYREPWPWLLMAGPAAVIVAGIYTTVLAVASSDGVVADDYYKLGLAINKTMQREDRARALGLSAGATYLAGEGRVRVVLSGPPDLPAAITFNLAHPTRAGMDRKVVLRRGPDGAYEGGLVLPAAAGHWNAVIEAGDWRMAGAWTDPARLGLTLGPRS